MLFEGRTFRKFNNNDEIEYDIKKFKIRNEFPKEEMDNEWISNLKIVVLKVRNSDNLNDSCNAQSVFGKITDNKIDLWNCVLKVFHIETPKRIVLLLNTADKIDEMIFKLCELFNEETKLVFWWEKNY